MSAGGGSMCSRHQLVKASTRRMSSARRSQGSVRRNARGHPQLMPPSRSRGACRPAPPRRTRRGTPRHQSDPWRHIRRRDRSRLRPVRCHRRHRIACRRRDRLPWNATPSSQRGHSTVRGMWVCRVDDGNGVSQATPSGHPGAVALYLRMSSYTTQPSLAFDEKYSCAGSAAW